MVRNAGTESSIGIGAYFALVENKPRVISESVQIEVLSPCKKFYLGQIKLVWCATRKRRVTEFFPNHQ